MILNKHIFSMYFLIGRKQVKKYVFSHFLSCGMNDSINWVQFHGLKF